MTEGLVKTVSRPEPLRWFILIAIAALVVVTASLAKKASTDSPLTSLLTICFCLAMIWFGWSLYQARASVVTFDGERLYDDAGVEICAFDEIATVERGMALFKPSSGFVLTLREEKPRAWSPGLWWRIGKRVGVGGATPGRAGRDMADAIMGALAAAGRL